MVKLRSKQTTQKKSIADNTAIEALADKLADKPYGDAIAENTDVSPNPVEGQEEMDRITISVPQSMRYLLEDTAIERKRAKEPSRSISAITRDALEDYFKKIGKI